MTGLVLLSHPVHESITAEEMRDALDDKGAPLLPVKVEPARFGLADAPRANWGDLRRSQEEVFEKKLRPLLEEYPDYEVAYFGLAPVALAIHLGSLVERWRSSQVYQRHHIERGWRWKPEGEMPLVDIIFSGMPRDVVRSDDDVVVRVSVTAQVDPKETAKVVPLTSAEIDVGVLRPGEDVLRTRSDLEAVAARVKEVLDSLTTHRPNARRVHLFAAVPAGLAFRIGTLVSATQHHRVQTYQYYHAGDPRHVRAILLGDNSTRVRELTNDEREAAGSQRDAWAVDLERVREFSRQLNVAVQDVAWFDSIDLPAGPLNASWRSLARFSETVMASSALDTAVRSVDGAFRYDGARGVWLVDDQLIVSINRRLGDSQSRERAGRMLFFHEALHVRTHRLTEATAPAIRRFPKILEEVDYQADVWAMLHELAFSKKFQSANMGEDHSLFLEIVKTAVETMWAFDDGPDELNQIEVRRVNRYLIWYWQLLRLERARSLADIVALLSKKPLIELAGPRIHADGDRVFFELREPWAVDLELAVQLDDGGIVRHGRGGATDVPALIDGLRKRAGEKVRRVLKGIVDQQIAH